MRGDDAATDSLLDSLEDVDRMMCEEVADTASLPTEWISKLEKIANATSAPAEVRDIAAKVESGELTWEAWYDDPGAHDGGIDLMNELHHELGSDIAIPDLTP